MLQVVQPSRGGDDDGWRGLSVAELVEVVLDRDTSEEGGNWYLGSDVLAEIEEFFEDLVCELSCRDEDQTLMGLVSIAVLKGLDQLQH